MNGIYLGANAAAQALNFAYSALFGLLGGVFALLYLRRSSPVERALSDLFATLMIGGIYILSAEVLLGKPELYCLIGYLAGVALPPSAVRLIKRAVARRREKLRKN